MQYKKPGFYIHVETRNFFVFQNISVATIFFKNCGYPFLSYTIGYFIYKQKIRNIGMSIWTVLTIFHQKLNFFVRKSWLSVTVKIPAKKNMM